MAHLIKMMHSLRNQFYQRKLQKKTNSRLHKGALIDKKTKLGGFNEISEGANACSSEIGIGSYIGPNSSIFNCVIGNYCSISWNVRVVNGVHPSKTFVSTSPCFYASRSLSPFDHPDTPFSEFAFAKDGKHYAIIGNDVWIGCNVLIKGGVSIGDGAIIGMGAIVTKDVPPYAIVAGNPAKVIRFRFTQPTIKELLDVQWWNKSPDELAKLKNVFSDVDLFLHVCSKDKK